MRPMTTQQERRSALLQKLTELEGANKNLAAAKNALKIAEMQAGQTIAEVFFGGISIPVFRLDRDTSYMPKIAYGRDGRCAIDTAHREYFVGDDTRWTQDGDTRACLWCGRAKQVMVRWTETVERQQWRDLQPNVRAKRAGTALPKPE